MSAVLTPTTSSSATAWRMPTLMLCLIWLGLLLVYLDTAAGIVGIWARSDTFAHGFLVLPISAWLVWRGRDRLAVLQPRPAWPWMLPLLAAAALWLLGELVAVNALTQFALVAMLVLAVPLVLGWPAARAMLFPLLFLFFGVPVGEFMTDPMMLWTADFTVAALRLSGVPVYREGMSFMIPSGNWSVVEACSGVRYLIASLMVGTLFAYLNYRSLTRRLVFVGVSILVPIVANWLRAYMIVMLGHLSNNRIATGVDHLVYGWVFFGVVIMIMFMIGARWSEPDRPREQPGGAGPVLTVGASPAVWAIVAAAALGAMLLPGGAVRAMQASISTAPVKLASEMPTAAAWRRLDQAPDWQPRFEGASATSSVSYESSAGNVSVYLAYYRSQTSERKLVSSVNMLVGSMDPQWSVLSVSRREIGNGADAVSWRVTHLLGRSGSLGLSRRHRTAWQTYWVDDRLTSSDFLAKLLGALGLLAGRGDDGAALVLHTELAPDEGGNALIEAFVKANQPALRHMLRQARSGG